MDQLLKMELMKGPIWLSLLNQFDFRKAAATLHVTASLLHEDFAGEIRHCPYRC